MQRRGFFKRLFGLAAAAAVAPKVVDQFQFAPQGAVPPIPPLRSYEPLNVQYLKEAIADAKAVRATALANARQALEEAFRPRFEQVFCEKLNDVI